MAGHTHMVLLPRPLVGTPVALGSGSNGAAGVISNFAITTGANIIAGDLVVVAIQLGTNNTVTAASVTDGTNTYTRADTTGIFSASEVSIWYCANAVAVTSGASITCTFSVATSGTGNSVLMAAFRVPSMSSVPLDKIAHNSNLSSPTSLTSTTGTAISTIPELFVGTTQIVNGTGYAGAQTSAGAAYTILYNFADSSVTRMVVDVLTNNLSGTASYVASIPSSTRAGSVLATFKGL